MDDFVRHPLTLVAAASILAAAFTIIVARINERRTTSRKMGDVVHDIDTFVLPHFKPDDHGSFEHTLPVRLAANEQKLGEHMKLELEHGGEIAAELKLIDNQLAEGKIEREEGKKERAEIMRQLAAGNPKIRRDPSP